MRGIRWAPRPWAMVALAVTVVVTGCSALHNDYAKVGPGQSAVATQSASWKADIHSNPDGGRPIFEPIQRAQQAVAKAQSAGSQSNELDSARQALNKATSQWAAIKDYDDPGKALDPIAAAAHRAMRLAEIARYQAEDKHNTDQLARLGQRASTRGSATDNRSSGQVVVPGRLGTIDFGAGSAKATAKSRAVIQRLAKYLQSSANADRHIGIAGRTAPISPDSAAVAAFVKANPRVKQRAKTASQQRSAYKQALAVTRARDVAELLARAGVSRSRIGIGIAQAGDVSGATGSDVIVEVLSKISADGS